MKYANHILLDVKSSRNLVTNKIWFLEYNERINSSYFKNYYTLLYKNDDKTHFDSYNSVALPGKGSVLTNPILLVSYTNLSSNPTNLNNSMGGLFDINFLRKEHMYTKLKYSRCPQYDIVSGGVAALLAGFFGFLVGEKFGLELLDSGDFYFALMYLVFICIIGRLFLRILDKQTTLYELVNLSWLYTFYRDLFTLVVRKLLPIVPFFPHVFYKSIYYVKSFEYLTYTYYMFWRVIEFIKWYPVKEF